MLNVLWPSLIIITIIYCFIFGNISELSNSIFDGINDTVSIVIGLVGPICFWNGIMNIIKNTSILKKFEILSKPVINNVFPKIKKGSQAHKNITLNITSNILGLGNAATPLGLKAMEEMKKENNNKNELSKEMKIFILINTASIQIIPTTVIALRSTLNSESPAKIIFPVWIVSISVFLFVVIVGKYVFRREK